MDFLPPLSSCMFRQEQTTVYFKTCVCVQVNDGNVWASRGQGTRRFKCSVHYTCSCILFLILRVTWLVIYCNFSPEEAGFGGQLREQKVFFVHKTGTALREMRGDLGPHAHSSPGLSRDLITTFYQQQYIYDTLSFVRKAVLFV